MNIVQLKAFVAVADRGSFSAAARELGLSQPAVTMQIQALEADLGVTLLDRRYRSTIPTEAGQALLPKARAILDELRAAREELASMADHVGGHLVIAASTTPGQYVLPRLLGGFLERYPAVGVTLRVSDSANVVMDVAEGDAAVGMTGASNAAGTAAPRVSFEALGTDEILVIAHPDHPMTRRSGMALSELAEERFVVRELGSGTRAVVETALRDGGLEPERLHVALELGTNEAIVSAVEGGLGVGTVSRWAADKALSLGTVAALDVEGFPVSRPFFLVASQRELPVAATAFADYLREALGPEPGTSKGAFSPR